MAGIGIINIFSTAIFTNVHKGSDIHKFSLNEENYYIGLSGFIGSLMALWTVKYLTRRALFIGGHFVMGILHILCAYYIEEKKSELVLIYLCAFIVVY